MKKINLILAVLSICFISSCSSNNESLSQSKISSSINSQERQYKEFIGLPNHSYQYEIDNPSNYPVEDLTFDQNKMYIEILNKKSLQITLYDEFETSSLISYKLNGEEKSLSITCLDLQIINTTFHVNLNEPTEIKLNKNVEANYSVKGENVSISGNKVTATQEGIFQVVVDYGNIHLEQTFDSYISNKEITTMTRDNPFMKLHGRNYHESSYVHIDNEGSGFEVTFKGTRLEAYMSAPFGSWYGETFVTVMVDSNNPTDKQVCLSNGSTKFNYTLVTDLDDGIHTVKVLKRSEALSTWLNLYSISTDGQFYPVSNKDKLKIEAYGDSITAGYGNLRGSLGDTTSSRLQSGLQTWASYTAWNLDADINIQARTGIGLYTSSSMLPGENVIDYYSKVTYDGEYNWIFSNYIPDIVLINLGTNDFWNGATTAQFLKNYITLVASLADAYGDQTSFVFASGFMEDQVYDNILLVKDNLEDSLSNKIYTYKFNRCKGGHPLDEEHKEGAAGLTELLKNNHLNIIHNAQTVEETNENTLKAVLQDEIPQYVTVQATIGSITLDLVKEDNFHYSTSLETISNGEYDVTFALKGDGDYKEIGDPIYKIRIDGQTGYCLTLKPFKAFPKDDTPDPYFGWSASSHLFDCTFTPNSEKDVSVSNINWKAGSIIRDPIAGNNYSLSVHIQSDATNYTDKYVGLVPYFLDDSTFVIIYLQWTSGKTLKSIGCTGLSNNIDIGWHDYWTFNNVQADLSNGVDLSISRSGTSLTIKAFGLSETQTISCMSGDSYKVGVWQYMSDLVNYTNFTQSTL